MKQYVLRKVKGEVRQRFVADIISTDAGMGLFYIDTPDGPELIAAIKLGVGDVIENEGCEAPAWDKVEIQTTVGKQYVTVGDLINRYHTQRKSLIQYQEQLAIQQEKLRTQARVIQNLSEINKQLEDHNVIVDPSMFNRFVGKDTNPPQQQVTCGQANNQGQAEQQVPGATSRFELDQECERFFSDHD